MKSKRRPGRRVWAKLFVTGLLFIQGYAWAQECHFGQSGEGGESTIINTRVTGAPSILPGCRCKIVVGLSLPAPMRPT